MVTWNDTFIQTGHSELILQNIRFKCIWIIFPRKCHAENSNIYHFPSHLRWNKFPPFQNSLWNRNSDSPQQVASLLFHCVNHVATTICNNRSNFSHFSDMASKFIPVRAAGAEKLHNFKKQAIIPYVLRVSKLKSTAFNIKDQSFNSLCQ